jgi:diguanylate cyclase (GGDEF)-like protein
LLKSFATQLVREFSVPSGNPELVKAQFEVFSRQIPLMYSIVLVNAWALSFLFLGVAPAWLSVVIPMAFTVICGGRLYVWWRSRHVSPTYAEARKALVRTNQFAALMSVTITMWALALSYYGDQHLTNNIAFFMAITGVSVVVCLLHLRSAAFTVALVIAVPFIVRFSLDSSSSSIAMAINMLFVTAILLVVVAVQSGHFANAIDARTKLELANRENFRLANRDSLTGLNNRRRFFSQLEQVFEKAQSQGRCVAVGVLDLDGFKPVNDLYGHVVGDALLMEVGQRLTELADETVHVSRLGGDEFALIFLDCGDDAHLLQKGDELCAALRRPVALADVTVRISASMGLAVFPALADTALQLYERADYALYNGKRTRRGRATLFTNEHVMQIARSTRLEQVLRDADLKNEMSVFFQPIVDSQTGKAVAFEALARWTSPVLGEVSPGLFIPVAERAGLVSRLTRVLLEKALAAASGWPQDMRLSFNLSANDIGSSEGVVRIVGILSSSGFDPGRVDFEITETAMMYDFEQAKASIETLRQMGCGIALDDFGTGFSSLSQIHALPLTKIKIDRSFVSDIDETPASYKIVKSLVALSRDMGLDCVVEGVETKEELATLDKLGASLIQGYYFSAPVPEAELARFVSGSFAAGTGTGRKR